MLSFKLNANDNLVLTTNKNGLTTLATVNAPISYSQLVRLRLLVPRYHLKIQPLNAIDWFGLMENKRLESVLGTEIRALISDTQGVKSVDLSNAKYTLNPFPKIVGICFELDCGNQQVVNI